MCMSACCNVHAFQQLMPPTIPTTNVPSSMNSTRGPSFTFGTHQLPLPQQVYTHTMVSSCSTRICIRVCVVCREIEILHPVDKLGRWGERPTNLKHLSKEEQREFKHIDFERPPTPPPQTSEIDTIICRMRGIHPEPVLVPQKEETINLDPGIPCPPGAYVPPPVPYTLALVSCNDMVVTPASTCFCLLGAGGCLRRGGRQAAAQKSTLTTAESGEREPCLAKACTRTFIVTWGGVAALCHTNTAAKSQCATAVWPPCMRPSSQVRADGHL